MKSIFTSPRRVRIVEYALFGVFIFHFTAVLHAEDLLVVGLKLCPSLTEQYLLAHPQLIGAATTLLLLPLFVWSNERWQWLTRIGSSFRQLSVLFLSFFLVGISLPSNEERTLERQTARLYTLGLKDKAFRVGQSYPFTTARLQMLRMEALGSSDRLGKHLFELPMLYFSPQERNRALQQLSIPVTEGGLSYSIKHGKNHHTAPRKIQELGKGTSETPQKNLGKSIAATSSSGSSPHQNPIVTNIDESAEQGNLVELVEPPYITALLDGKLSQFVHSIPRQYLKMPSPEQIPLYYRQALVLYMRLNTHPILTYVDDATEANYRDFLKQQRDLRMQYPPPPQHTFSISEKNKMNFFFGNTYWYYFFYEVPRH